MHLRYIETTNLTLGHKNINKTHPTLDQQLKGGIEETCSIKVWLHELYSMQTACRLRRLVKFKKKSKNPEKTRCRGLSRDILVLPISGLPLGLT